MLCPNCKQEFSDGNKCPHCKVDVVVFKKITKLSDSLYNKGLALAKASDLTGAVSFLQKSIQINKDNVQAYNLLGIVHFEMGHIGDAVKQWVISSNRSQEGNPASHYIDELSKNGTMLEKLSDSISMYNNALKYLTQKSDDLAIIQLKKAIEINPKFVDALNLLTLCFLIQQDKEKASQLVEKVLYIDAQNPLALNYHNVLHPGKRPVRKSPGTATPVVTRATPPPEQPYKNPVIVEKKHVNFHLAEIVTFIVGVACTVAVYNWMMMPTLEREAEQRINELNLDYIAKEAEYVSQIEEKDDLITGLEERLTTLENDAEAAERQNELLSNTNRVMQAYDMYTDGRLQDAVDYASDIDLTGQPPDIIERHQSIFIMAYPLLAEEYFDSGTDAFNDDDYAKAKADFEKAVDYAPEDARYIADLIYRLGTVYAQEESTKEQAVEYLTRLTEEYPNYRQYWTARNLLEDLTEE